MRKEEFTINLTAGLEKAARELENPKAPLKIKYIKDHAEACDVNLDRYAAKLVEFLEDGIAYAEAIEMTNDFYDIWLLAERLNAPQPPKRQVTKNSVEYFVRKYPRAMDAKTYIRELIPLCDYYKNFAKACEHLNKELSNPDYLYNKMGVKRREESAAQKNINNLTNRFR